VSIEPVDPKLGLPSVTSTSEGKSTQNLRNATGVEKHPKLLTRELCFGIKAGQATA
jgi:hypothetical protein